MPGRVQTTREERQAIAEKAANLFNLLFDDWKIVERSDGMKFCVPTDEETDNEKRGLAADDIKITQVTKTFKGGHMMPHESREYWKLGVKFHGWREYWTDERKLQFLIHELAHMPHIRSGHRPVFWETHADAINAAAERHEEVEEVMGASINMDAVRDRSASSIKSADGVEDRDQQLWEFCRAIDYDPRYVDAFDETQIRFDERCDDEADEEIPAEKLVVEDDIRDWRLYSELDKYSPAGRRTGKAVKFLHPILVEPEQRDDGAYVAKRGTTAEARAALIRRVRTHRHTDETQTVPVRIRE